MNSALLIIDMQNFVLDRMQKGVDFYPPDNLSIMERVLEQFRKGGKPVIHVRHADPKEGSDLHTRSPLSLPIEKLKDVEDEPVFIKHTSSAFSSTNLLSYLHENQISELVVIGAVTGFCVNSTVRMGADIGLTMTVLKDAVIGFELKQQKIGAQAIHEVTLALLGADFARVIAFEELKIV